MSLSPCRLKSYTWVVSGIYVRVVMYMVKLTRSGIVIDLVFVQREMVGK